MTDTVGSGRRVAILGGGIASLSTAWRLSTDPAIGQITVYQRGWRLGGKGASSRGDHERIEEHGLHIWLGYYDNAFRVMREAYEVLDRAGRQPDCPIAGWTDAFKPAPHVGLATRGDFWDEWTALFSTNDQVPGEPDGDTSQMGPAEFVRRSMSLVSDYIASLEPPRSAGSGRVILSARPAPPVARIDLVALTKRTIDAVSAAALEVAHLSAEAIAPFAMGPAAGGAVEMLESLRSKLAESVAATPARRRLFELIDLVVSSVRGIIADGLLVDPRGFSAINDEEYTDWLRRHGAAEETFSSPLVTGVYDLVFGYRDGDPNRPRFAAGTAVLLGAKIFFDYKGSIFWKMQAGMGEVVFAPMYEVLRQRGVRFEFFHQVDELELGPSGDEIAAVTMTRQARLAAGLDEYQPLQDFGGVPCFPDVPDVTQLAEPIGRPREMERLWGDEPTDTVAIRAGADYDVLVYGISIGMVPFTCGQLLDHSERWRDMVANVGTVATQAFQLWLDDDETALGWKQPGSTVTGFVKPFDTIASMSHLLPVEGWSGDDKPGSIIYFCNTLPEPPPPGRSDVGYPDRQLERVRGHAIEFLDEHVGPFLPGATTDDGFDWQQVVGAGDTTGPDRFDSQFWTANVDPSDRYVQSVPGSDRFRIRCDDSGFTNLYLTGDWTDCGLNAGCIEAAVISGLQTANAIGGHQRWSGISGYWKPLGDR